MKRAQEFEAGRSKSAVRRREWRDRIFPEGTRFGAAPVSRQTERAILRDSQYSIQQNVVSRPPRRERRALARAVAARIWKDRKKEKAT